jgi:hypothetical protein
MTTSEETKELVSPALVQVEHSARHLADGMCALWDVVSRAAEILDDEHADVAVSLRFMARTLNDLAGELVSDVLKMQGDPGWITPGFRVSA